MSHGIDAAVDRNEAARPDPTVDRSSPEPQSAQLRSGHETVLSLGDRPDQTILTPLFIHVMNKGATLAIRPPGGPAQLTVPPVR
jgi:hypothetical protein